MQTTDVLKRCDKCQSEHPASHYWAEKRNPDGLMKTCKDCRREYLVKWRQENPRKVRAYNKRSEDRNRLKWQHGITNEQYTQMLEKQGGVCGICGLPPKPNKHAGSHRLHVDHDHHTGVVRGLLCAHCNQGLGHFRENMGNLLSAIAWVQVGREMNKVHAQGYDPVRVWLDDEYANSSAPSTAEPDEDEDAPGPGDRA